VTSTNWTTTHEITM